MWKSEIAAKTGIHEMQVGKYLARLGIPKADNRSDSMIQRMQRMKPEERLKLTENAHEAVRGMIRTEEDLCKRALGKERMGKTNGKAESDLYHLLLNKDIQAIPQRALWKYNIDLAIGNVAVEVTGRCRKPEQIPALRERIKYILNSGFVLVYVWASTIIPVEAGAADYIITLYQQSCCDPSMIGQ
jgi:hypothetical protein